MTNTAAAWVVLCSFLVTGGWLLSLLHHLDATGYALLLLAGAGLFFWWKKQGGSSCFCRKGCWPRLRRRFRRPLALGFLILAVLAILGGVLHPPNMYDAMTYRVPRMLHWLSEGRWHWIHTGNARMNVRAADFEWVCMPLLALSKTDRLFFLANAMSFLVLPGLIFGVFNRLGVRPRAAWCWMWLAPTGYSFLLQAGGAANDMFGAPFVLASIYFALRAVRDQRASDLWLSMLAAGLMTGSKASNLPLLLPWLLAVAPAWRLAFAKPVRLVLVSTVAAGISYLPVAILNVNFCGDWSGSILEPDVPKAVPWVALAGNSALLLTENLVPPVFPMAPWWNQSLPGLVPETWFRAMEQSFQHHWWKLNELPIEDSTATGFGVTILTVLSVLWAVQMRLRHGPQPRRSCWRFAAPPTVQRMVAGATWVGLAAFLVKVGLQAPGRIVTPFVPLLLAGLLRPAWHERLVRERWWTRLALAVMAIAGFVVIVSPPRPLWPAQRILHRLAESRPSNRILVRAETVYGVYRQRHDALAGIRQAIPADVRLVGAVLSPDDPETSLWRPFGARRVIAVLSSDRREDLRRKGIEYVVLSSRLQESEGIGLEEWLKKYDAEVAAEEDMRIIASEGGERKWHLARLRTGKPQ